MLFENLLYPFSLIIRCETEMQRKYTLCPRPQGWKVTVRTWIQVYLTPEQPWSCVSWATWHGAWNVSLNFFMHKEETKYLLYRSAMRVKWEGKCESVRYQMDSSCGKCYHSHYKYHRAYMGSWTWNISNHKAALHHRRKIREAWVEKIWKSGSCQFRS